MSSITSYWTDKLLEQARPMSSLKYLSKDQIKIGTQHSIYRTVKSSILDVRKCIIKTRMVTRTYTLQTDKHKFSRYKMDPMCELCKIENEDLPHMLTTCVALVDIRNEHYTPIKYRVIEIIGTEKWKEIFNTRLAISKLIVDCSNYAKFLLNQQNIDEIETLCRNFCYKLHNKRIELLRMAVDT